MAELDFFVQLPPKGKLEVDLRLQRILKDIDDIKAPNVFADLKIIYEECMEDGESPRAKKFSTNKIFDGSKIKIPKKKKKKWN